VEATARVAVLRIAVAGSVPCFIPLPFYPGFRLRNLV
jgi:hypothetical protein